MRRSLRTRIAFGLFLSTALIASAILLLGRALNERAELTVWEAVLTNALEHVLARRADDASYPLPAAGTLYAYALDRRRPDLSALPPALRALPPGLHDDVALDNGQAAVLVRDVGDQRMYMLIDISGFETIEHSMIDTLVAIMVAVTVFLAWFGWWASGRLLQPLSEFAIGIDRLVPTLRGGRVAFDRHDGREIVAIGNAVNGLLDRIDGYVAREREFITTASHELRTPIATIIGAAELTEAHPDLTDALRRPLGRIQSAAREIDQLIQVLLVLAKAPERIMESADVFSLDELVAEVVDDHRPLTAAKSLEISTGTLTPCRIRAPQRIAQVALANLVRNAIEHSDHGAILVSIDPAGLVRVTDPGHGAAAHEIGQLYAALARRGDAGFGGGIGLELLARICEHLDWVLRIEAVTDGGTSALLDLRASLRAP
jgi:signal transduction histidine kinase